MTDRTLTYEEEFAWASLQGRSAQFIMKHGTVEDMVREAGDLLRGQSDSTIDECFTILMDKDLAPVDTLRVVKSWLLNDKVTLNPSRLKVFDEFHKIMSKFMFRDKDHTYTAEEDEVYERVQVVLGRNY